MDAAHVKLLTIVVGSEYKNELSDTLKTLGVPGFTIGEVRGQGSHEPRISFWDGTNIKIEILANAGVTERVLDYLNKNYLPRVALIAYVMDVAAIPAGQFESKG